MMNSESFFKVYNASAGSGKTYTLVKEYLKVALLYGEFEFQKILAITFTNKAAGVMKERVLKTLKDASQKKENPIASDIAKETNLSLEEIQEKSKKVLDHILQNYASFHIITIDSFTHKLIRTFSLDLGLPLDFEVEMDVDPLLKETIDLLVAKIGEDKDLTNVLVDYTLHQVNDDKSWNINDSLVEVAKLLLNEENEVEVAKLINTSLSDFKSLEKRLRDYVKQTEKAFKDVGEQALQLIDENGINHKSFSSGDLPNYFKKFLGSCFQKEELPLTNRLAKNMDAGVFYAKSKSASEKATIDAVKEELTILFNLSQELCNQHFGQYLLVKKILKTLVPLTVLSYIHKEFTNYKEENNFRLNAEFNRVISKQIKDEPVPFIYERLGEKFQYFFIDEMQDTSELQWENLIPLIHNTLSQNSGGLMLVGDAKQSIYRWRGGKASQFVALSNPKEENQFYIDKQVVTLDTNYRSYSNIINFNNDFFSFISSYLKNSTYQEIYEGEKHQKTNSKQGGYVRLELFEREKDFDSHEFYGEKIYHQILEIEKNGFDRGDICILTRKKNDGIAVADYLVSQGVEVISTDSLLLKNNKTVQFLVYVLRWLENAEDKEVFVEVLYFLYDHLQIEQDRHAFFAKCISFSEKEDFYKYIKVDFSEEQFFSDSIYDGIEYIIRTFSLVNLTDVFVQTFLDVVLQFQLKDSGGLQTFIEYWGLRKEKLKVEVAKSKNAVQIMTIHKSKGLEFPVVIFPFDLNTEDIVREQIWYQTENSAIFGDFDSFRINASNKLELYGESGVAQLEKVSQETQLDNFNLLYVALTRAEEQLYVFSDIKPSKTKAIKNYSDFFKEYISEKGSDFTYEVGNIARLSKKEEDTQDLVLDRFESIDKKKNNIHVVESKEQDESIEFGNIIHKAFEKIYDAKDLPIALSYLEQQGFSEELEFKAKKIILDVVQHPELKEFYEEGLEVYNEYSLMDSNSSLFIIDRLVLDGNKAIVIDYKTGQPDESHKVQLEKYSSLLSVLGCDIVKKVLIYCGGTVNIDKV